MPDRLRDHGTRAPSRRLRDRPNDGYFFPREVAAILDIPDIDYHQLRRLYLLVRAQSGVPANEGWARYTLRDIAAIKVAIDLCGGKVALRRGQRLQVKCLEEACLALREQGIANPLLDVKLVRVGRQIFADLAGTLLNPVTGQTALAAALPVAKRIAGRSEPALLTKLQEESRPKRKPTRPYRRSGATLAITNHDGAATATSATA